MPAVTILFVLVLGGAILWAVGFIGMPRLWYNLIIGAAVVLALLWLGQQAHIVGGPTVTLK